MKIDITSNGKAIDSSFYRLQWEACIECICSQLQLWGPLTWLDSFNKEDKLQVKGDRQILFTGKVMQIAEVEHSRVLVTACELLNEELLLNFHKEQWSNILKEVWPEYNFDGEDFEQMHYSVKDSKQQHLRQLHSRLEKHSKKPYWLYLNEENKLQIQETGNSRGNTEITGTLISKGNGYRVYKPFPLVLGMATAEGITERLELVIDGVKEQLKVWWGEAKDTIKSTLKDTIETAKDAWYGDGMIANSSDRIIYAIIGDTEAVVSVHSGSTHSALIDGIVDVIGKQVYKMNENTYLEFTAEYKFIITEYAKLEATAGKFSSEPYGVYVINDNVPEAIHKETGYKSKAIKSWYDKARIEQ